MEAEPAKGPAPHGREDQRWTLSRVKTVIGRRFHLSDTIQGVRELLVRNGRSCPVPARRAIERDDEAVAERVKVGVPPLAGECGPARKTRGGPWGLARLDRTKPDSP
ncbi:winged helix-turn-helix domain-containing protein [Streptomyces sp. NPDC051051]|uniref:helix-turn-helix domain-containing protein n=1 Tax=Streptomyces sp. NPDC051051 TaxID=3155666 RepID=UPI0034392BD5